MILPGAMLGLLGGGQLGRMFCLRAREMGYRVTVLDPDPESPAGALADCHLQSDYTDTAALAHLARHCAAVTTEFENVPAASLEQLAASLPVRPGPTPVAIAQDRLLEKAFLQRHGLATAAFAPVGTVADLDSAWNQLGAPALLKTCRLGYDGKGQEAVATREGLGQAFDRLGRSACVLERRLSLEGEISIVLARGADGEVASFPAGENVHRGGILETTTVPARVAAPLAAEATTLARRLADALEYVGVLAVELFIADGGRLFVNELAPRPHNSAHYTLDACITDQFEQQLRALCGLPLGDPSLICPATMINLLGDEWRDGSPRWERALAVPGVKLHLYGKRDARPGRKMGHLNVLAPTAGEALSRALKARDALRPPHRPD